MAKIKMTLTFEVDDYSEDVLHMLLNAYGGDDSLDADLRKFQFEWAEEMAYAHDKPFDEFYFPWKITGVDTNTEQLDYVTAIAKVSQKPKHRTFLGKLWRTKSGFVPEGTVADVVRYEQDELGNDLGVSEHTLGLLEGISADHVIWATKDRNSATRYGDDVIPLHLGAVVVLGEDGDGGYLVLSINPIDRSVR